MKQIKDFSIFSNKSVLIIGGQGFVGQSLIKKLSQVKCRVFVFDKHIYKRYKDVKHIIGDVTDAKDVEKAVKGKDIVIDLAALRPIESMQHPFDDLKITALGTLHILEACRKYNKNCRIIFFGSSLEYGKVKNLPVTENNNTFDPNSLYGIHKHAVSHYARIYHNLYGIKNTVLRFSHIYGPEEARPGKRMSIINSFIHKALKSEELHIFGSGFQLRDFIYVDDAIRAVALAITCKRAEGEVFNIGTGKPYSINNVAKVIVRIVGGGKVVKKNWPEPYQKIEQGNYYTDFSKAKKVLGWKPMINLEEGLKMAVEIIINEHSKSKI